MQLFDWARQSTEVRRAHRESEDRIAWQLQKALDTQQLQHWQRQAAVQVLGCEQSQGMRTELPLQGCLKLL